MAIDPTRSGIETSLSPGIQPVKKPNALLEGAKLAGIVIVGMHVLHAVRVVVGLGDPWDCIVAIWKLAPLVPVGTIAYDAVKTDKAEKKTAERQAQEEVIFKTDAVVIGRIFRRECDGPDQIQLRRHVDEALLRHPEQRAHIQDQYFQCFGEK